MTLTGIQIPNWPWVSSRELIFGGEEISIPETHGPFGNCIPVIVNQVIKGIEISQWPSHI